MRSDFQPESYHAPVLLGEVVEYLAPAPGKRFVDCTLGGGGHSAALLQHGASVIGVDQDPEAIAFATQRLSDAGERFVALRGNFADIADVLSAAGVHSISGGALLDLGVSSHQFDTPERGFSLMKDGPLDMRMDPDTPLSAADLVNTMSVEQLARIFRQYGEEPAANRIAERIVKVRAISPIRRTLELATTIETVVPRRGRIHPATRVFQALRIAVNRELEAVQQALEQLMPLLEPSARLAVITFHSLEDRIVKQFFKERTTQFLDRPEWPQPRPNPKYQARLVTRKAVIATEDEQSANPRSRSAKLRVIERI